MCCGVNVCVCVLCGRRCDTVHVAGHIRGVAGKMQAVIQAVELVYCPPLDI